MKYTSANTGRQFVLRLEDGEIIHEKIEQFALDMNIKCASISLLGAADRGSVLVCGPEEGRSKVIKKMLVNLDDVYEIHGTGTIFIDAQSIPKIHLHISCGRKEKVLTGCARQGIIVWHIVEVIITELLDCNASRKPDPSTGFELLYIK